MADETNEELQPEYEELQPDYMEIRASNFP